MRYYLLTLLYITFCFAEGDSTIAVLDFEGNDIEVSVAKTLSERVRNQLIEKSRYVVLDRLNISSILKEQGLQQSGCTNSDCAVEIGQLLGVRFIVIGSIGKVGSTYHMTARLISVQTGEVLKSSEVFSQAKIDELLLVSVEDLVDILLGIEKPWQKDMLLDDKE